MSASVSAPRSPAPDHIINGDFESIPAHPSWFTEWNRWGTIEGIQTAGWHKGLLPGHPDGLQPHTGRGFYGAVSGSNTKDGGIYQTIAVEPDALYEVSVWGYPYQTDDGRRGAVATRLA